MPLLLHPVCGPDPSKHLSFNHLGQVYAEGDSPYGIASILVFRLNREELAERRRECIETAETALRDIAIGTVRGEHGFAEAVEKLFHPSVEYSAAIRCHAERWVEDLVEEMRLQPASP